MNVSQIPPFLKQGAVKKLSLNPTLPDNYQPISSVPFLGKGVEHVVASHFLGFRNELDYLDLFQSIFKPGYEMEMTLLMIYVKKWTGGMTAFGSTRLLDVL